MTAKRSPQIKKISPWVVLVLGVVTLGIYSLVWVRRRYGELGTPTKMSHWLVLIAVVVVGFVVAIAAMLAGAFMIESVQTAAELTVYGTWVCALILSIIIALWMVRYVRRIDTAFKVDMPLWATFMTAFFFNPILTAYIQHRTNTRSSQLSFIAPTAASVIIGLGIIIANFVAYPLSREVESLTLDYAKMRQDLKEVERLSSEYTKCIDELNADYPGNELTDENYSEYERGYEACDKIYKKIQSYGY